MTTELSHVVVGYDMTAIERAAALAARAPFYVFHVLYVGGRDVDPDAIAATVEPKLRGSHFHVHVHVGRRATKDLVELAEDVGAELIIVGPRDAKVAKYAKCDVVIARADHYAPVKHVDVVEVDHHAHAHAPHHYRYDDDRAPVRPSDWPIY